MPEVAGIDGMTTAAVLLADGCCPPDLCQISPDALICNFIHMLPRGPLWDRAKAEALNKHGGTCTSTGYQLIPCGPAPCNVIVDHAIYSAQKLYHVLLDALWPALREANPATAHDTLDSWLERLGWRDCFDCACRDDRMTGLSPIEILGYDDGCYAPLCCPPEVPADLVMAVKKGIVLSLVRLNMGIIRNLAAINFVIAPLGAQVLPGVQTAIDLTAHSCHPDTGDGSETQPPDCPNTMQSFGFTVCNLGTTLPKATRLNCPPREGDPIDGTVQAFVNRDCPEVPGDTQVVWPGVMAAECIVRSLMPPGSRITLTRC